MEHRATEEIRDRAVLVGLNSPRLSQRENADESTMEELSSLVETAGGLAVGVVLQKKASPDPRTFIGEGKAAEVRELVRAQEATMVIFDNDLTPSQMRVLTEELGVQVLDRSGLILDIFAQRARTREGRLQVELAQYQYLLPRLVGMWTHLERQAGTSGKGPIGSKEKYKNFVLPHDLEVLKGNAAEEYPDYLGQCASLDENLGRLVERLKQDGLYDNTVILFASDHGSHFKTRNTDSHLNGYDDYKRSCHDGALHVPLVIAGGPYKGGKAVEELVSTESLPKTILALAGVDVGDAMIGENLLDVVEKKDNNRANQVFAQISESRVGRCVRTADYLYSVYAPGVNGGEAAASELYADDFLYDLKADPWQLNNVVTDPAYEAVKQDMRARLLDWIEKAEGMRPTIVD